MHEALHQVCQIGTARYLTDQLYRKGYYHNLGYTIIGKTGTAEITDDKSKELAWFVAWRDKEPDGTDITTEEARLVCVMLEINLNSEGKIPANTEIAQMKFDIARCMLKDSTLNRFYGEQGKNEGAVQLMASPQNGGTADTPAVPENPGLQLEVVPPPEKTEEPVYSLEVVG